MEIKNWMLRWKATWNPDMYHGWGREKRYFEGWYFKLATADSKQVFAVIPGISKDSNGRQHAFIQVLDGTACKASYHEFPAADFQASEKGFELQLGQNYFSAQAMELQLPELKGRLEFSAPTPWPKMLGAPGIMGWYSFVPFMECYHGVVSLHHQIKGNLSVYGHPVDFGNGIGYIEKDWGTSFPRSWIWMQSNHFDFPEKASVMASVAHIPWLKGYFIGYIAGFQLGQQLYRFATYTGASRRASLNDQQVEIAFRDKHYRLEITGEQAPGARLVSPLTGEMTGKVNESIQAKLHVRFYKGEKLVFEGTGRNGGLEIAGNARELLTNEWRR